MNGHLKIILSALSIAVACGSIVWWVGSIAADAGATKGKVYVLEERAREDRSEIKQKLDKIEERAQRTDENVSKILQEIRIIQDRHERLERRQTK